MTKKDLLLGILITMIWGFNFSIIKLGLDSLDPFMIAALRFLLVAVPLVFFIKRPNVSMKYIASYGILFGVGLWGIVTLGIELGISAGLSSLLLQSSVFFTMILGIFFLKEKIQSQQFIAILFGFIGIVLVFNVTDGSLTIIGALLVLLGALSWSFTNIIVKIANIKEMFSFIVWSSLFSPIPLFLLSYLMNGSHVFSDFFINLDFIAIFSILFQVYPTTLFGYWIWNLLLKKYSATYVAPLSLLVPVFGLIGSHLIFNESIGLIKILAGVLIVIGLSFNFYGQQIINSIVIMMKK